MHKHLIVNNATATAVFKDGGNDYTVAANSAFYTTFLTITYISTDSNTPLRLELRDGVGGTLLIPWVAPASIIGAPLPSRGDAINISTPERGLVFTAGNKIELALVAGSGRFSASIHGEES